MASRRDLLLRDFFPPPRTEPAYGIEVELFAVMPGRGGDAPNIELSFRLDELDEPPTIEEAKRLVDLLKAQLPEGAVLVSSEAPRIIRHLTDDERESP